jgi:hypothetical protein
MTTTRTTRIATIPASEHTTGFVAVALNFPGDTTAHRVTRIHHPSIDNQPGHVEIRPTCHPGSKPTERFYELSIPYALGHGAHACTKLACYGGFA